MSEFNNQGSLFIGTTPQPVTVTSRILPFLVGNPYKPSFVTVTGWGVDLTYLILGGGFNHPSEKYVRQIGLFPQGMNIKKYLKPPPSIHVSFNLNLKCLVIFVNLPEMFGFCLKDSSKNLFVDWGESHHHSALCHLFGLKGSKLSEIP